MESKSVAGQAPAGQYQTIPQPGAAPPTYPTDAPPKYEEGGYQQPPPSYPQPAYPQQQVYSQQPVLVTTQPYGFGNAPKVMKCQHCQASISTSLQHETGALTWLSAGLICIFGCWLGCCLIPFCIDDLQDVKHTCPNCNNVVGYFRRM